MINENKPYSNTKATLAIAKASFRSIIRSPSAVVFSLAFPLIFIIVFANIGGGAITADVGVAKTCDTANDFFRGLKSHKVANLVTNQSTAEMESNLSKGNIAAIIDIKKNTIPPYITVNTKYSTASGDKGNIFKMILTNIAYNANRPAQVGPSPIVELHETTIKGREYKYIDFLLPGMLGFSLLSSGVFGTAFVFLSLRLTLVIKRFFATPVKKYSIVLGEAIARLIFSWIGALFIIMVGHFFFGFTLVHGVVTVINMLILSAIGLIVFMGFGFIVSGIAKSDSAIPPFANLITLPQFLLAGTFFSIDNFPKWLQPFCKALPLTYLNDALRKIAFDGAGFWDVRVDILILLLWGVVIYAIASRLFKWE